MTIYGINMDGLGADSREAKIRRAATGALYGFLGGTAFVIVAGFIDIWLHPDLPLSVNWSAFLLRWLLIGLGLTLVGAVTCWWHEGWQGLILGAVTASAFALIVSLFSSQVGAGLKFVVLIFILMPVAAMTLPIAYLLRYLTERHARALRMNRGKLRAALLLMLIVIIGAGLGYFMKAPGRRIEAARTVDNYLRDLSTEKNPLTGVAGVPDRAALKYTMYSIDSTKSTEGYDVHIIYADGYKLQCLVILYPGSPGYLSKCEIGK